MSSITSNKLTCKCNKAACTWSKHHICAWQSRRTTTSWWRRSCSCNWAADARDRHILMMSAVVMSPAAMWTISNGRLTALTLHVIQPDLSTSCTIPVVDHPTYVPAQVTLHSIDLLVLINRSVMLISSRSPHTYTTNEKNTNRVITTTTRNESTITHTQSQAAR